MNEQHSNVPNKGESMVTKKLLGMFLSMMITLPLWAASYRGEVDQNGNFKVVLNFTFQKSESAEQMLRNLTENKQLMKASDKFITDLIVENQSNQERLITTKFKIKKIIPDEVKLSCLLKLNSAQSEQECGMIPEGATKKKFDQLNDHMECMGERCTYEFYGKTKSFFGYNRAELAMVVAETTLSRVYTMMSVLNITTVPALFDSSAENIQNGDFYTNNIDYLADDAEEEISNLNSDDCKKVFFSSGDKDGKVIKCQARAK